MFSFWIKEDQLIWSGIMGSLLIHGILFVFAGKTFIQHAQYNVQPSVQTMEVSIEEIKNSAGLEATSSPAQEHLKNSSDNAGIGAFLKSGVKVKANPDYFQNPSPEYPELAKQMKQEGLVMLVVDVDREGLPVKVEVQQSSGYHLLDRAALEAVSHWKFQPGSMGNIRVESTVTVPIRFRLEK